MWLDQLCFYTKHFILKYQFYSAKVLDETLEKYVEVFDLNDFENLAFKLKEFINGRIKFTQKIDFASEYFSMNCNNKKISDNYLKVLNEYKFFRSIWKK